MQINRAETAYHTAYYQRYAYMSVFHGGPVTRISVPVERPGGHMVEYFAIVQGSSGKQYRADRDEALEMIEAAIEQGLPAGEVRWSK